MMIPGMIDLSTSNVHDPGEKQVKYSRPFNLFLPHLAVRGMPTGREAAISSFLPPAPLLLQGMWIPSSASESWIQREDKIADLNSFGNLSLVFRIGYGLGRPQVLLV